MTDEHSEHRYNGECTGVDTGSTMSVGIAVGLAAGAMLGLVVGYVALYATLGLTIGGLVAYIVSTSPDSSGTGDRDASTPGGPDPDTPVDRAEPMERGAAGSPEGAARPQGTVDRDGIDRPSG